MEINLGIIKVNVGIRINKTLTHKQKYHEYLKSPVWKRTARLSKEIDGNKCTRCGSKRYLVTHHMTYDNIFNEKLTDLITLCNDCHKLEHGLGGKK